MQDKKEAEAHQADAPSSLRYCCFTTAALGGHHPQAHQAEAP